MGDHTMLETKENTLIRGNAIMKHKRESKRVRVS